MSRIAVASSTIKSMGHAGNILEVEFTSGAVYRYKGVPSDVAKRLFESPSIGKSFGQLIRNKYPHEKENPSTP